MLALPRLSFEPSAGSREAPAQELRLRGKRPAVYAREYQIPDAPRVNLLEAEAPEREVIVVRFQPEGPGDVRTVTLCQRKSLEALFLEPSAMAPTSPARPIIRRKTPVVADGPTTKTLRSLLQLLGVEATDEQEFLGELLSLLARRGPEALEKIVENSRKVLENFHKFRVFSQNGKVRAVLPVSKRESGGETAVEDAAVMQENCSGGEEKLDASGNEPLLANRRWRAPPQAAPEQKIFAAQPSKRIKEQ